MAARWSLPSGSVGGQRFRCWPLSTDSYNHVDLTANFDEVDGIIGTPSGGAAWPPTLGLDAGIYAQIQFLIHERAPIGSLWYWFRPSTAVPLSTYSDYGWVIADGSTLTVGNHDFPGIAGSVTLPNLLNAFPLGADSAKAFGTAGDGPSGGHPNDSLGAPGIGGTGGANAAALTSAQMPAHTHGLHDPGHIHTVLDPGHAHPMGDYAFGEESGDAGGSTHMGAAHTGTAVTNVTVRSAVTGLTLDNTGSGSLMDNRPRHVGLLPIIKVKHVTSV